MKITGPPPSSDPRHKDRSAGADGEEIEVFVSYLFTDASGMLPATAAPP
jgi:hypothetical protein